MLNAEFLTTGGEMPPQSSEGSLSLSGLPPEAVAAIAAIAGERGKTLKELYSDIASDFVAAIKAGEKPTYISTLRGSTRKTVWIDPDVADELDALCKSLGRTRSSVLLTAVQRFLVANGKTVEF